MAERIQTIRAVLMGGHEVLAGGKTLDAATAGSALVDRLIAIGTLAEGADGGITAQRLISVRGSILFGMPYECTRHEAGRRILNALLNSGMVRKIAPSVETQAPAPQEAGTATSEVETLPPAQETKAPSVDEDAPANEAAEAPAVATAKPRPRAKPKAKAESKAKGRK
jgi:hypothetical protein